MTSTLLLNADGAPVSMLPLSVISWQDAIKYLVLEKATPLEWHDRWIVHSERWQTQVPAVLILKEFEKIRPVVRYSKQNVFLRDGYICQYCGVSLDKHTATLDHVVPVSHGGKSTFENSTTACHSCNANKGNNHKIRPTKKPVRPTYYQLVEQRKKFPFPLDHHSWADYLGINN